MMVVGPRRRLYRGMLLTAGELNAGGGRRQLLAQPRRQMVEPFQSAEFVRFAGGGECFGF